MLQLKVDHTFFAQVGAGVLIVSQSSRWVMEGEHICTF